MDLQNMTARQIAVLIKDKKISVAEAALYFSKRADQAKRLNCFVSLTEEDALLKRAAAVQKGIAEGRYNSPLAGVPVAVKDNICTRELPTSCASKMLAGFMSPYDATVVTRLQEAGAVIVGKANMDEFAMGSTTETSYFGVVKNPWDETRSPGGSSGGSAAAVAAGLIPYALGSDTGGSIRQPCSYCGVSGVKPTYGAVSRYGLVAYGSSLDQIGTLARNIDDCAAALEIISGHDAADSTSLPQDPFDFSAMQEIKGRKIGLPENYLGEGLSPDVREAIKAAAEAFTGLGATVEYCDMPMMEYAVPAYYIIACAEASSNLARFDGIKYGYHPEGCDDLMDLYLTSRSEGFAAEVKRRILLGTFVLSSGYYDAYYQKAQQVRQLIRDAFNGLFAKYDMILSPVAPTTAPLLGESLNDPLKMYLSDVYTIAVNMIGSPAVSLPCGFDRAGLPIGLQLIGPVLSEPVLMGVGRAFQKATAWQDKRAEVTL